LSAVVIRPAWCDQWTAALTPTRAEASNYNGALSVYVTTTQPAVNPANWVAADGWMTEVCGSMRSEGQRSRVSDYWLEAQ